MYLRNITYIWYKRTVPEMSFFLNRHFRIPSYQPLRSMIGGDTLCQSYTSWRGRTRTYGVSSVEVLQTSAIAARLLSITYINIITNFLLKIKIDD